MCTRMILLLAMWLDRLLERGRSRGDRDVQLSRMGYGISRESGAAAGERRGRVAQESGAAAGEWCGRVSKGRLHAASPLGAAAVKLRKPSCS